MTNYNVFVDTLLSKESSDFDIFIERLIELNNQDANIHRLLTGAVGMSAEAGEFIEVVKKIIFQGKPFNEDNIFHMKRELSDIMFYVQTACLALNTSIDDIIKMNVEKLEARYPGGKFTVAHSENRKEGDL